jgi:PTS system maltose and glucose-specific IIC component
MTQEKSFKSKAWEFFQSLGKTFMFPVSAGLYGVAAGYR